MKNQMKKFGPTLALILATSASAQVRILPGAGLNALPAVVPGPIANIAPLSLPAQLLTPAVALAPALVPAPSFSAAPSIHILPIMPAAPIARAPHVMPILPIMPAVNANGISFYTLNSRAAASATDATPKNPAAEQDRLGRLFDGRRGEKEGGAPVRSDRHQSLPENDLEREIGAY